MQMSSIKASAFVFAVAVVFTGCNSHTDPQVIDIPLTGGNTPPPAQISTNPAQPTAPVTTAPVVPSGPQPSTSGANARYLDCKGTVYELYANFSQVDLTQTNIDTSVIAYGLRPIAAATAFSYYDSESESSAELFPGSPSFDYDGVDDAGTTLSVQIQGSGFVTANASFSLTPNGGKATPDSAICQWYQNDIYAN
jgi:hypothetical protein